MAIELKPCKCGDVGEVWYSDATHKSRVVCSTCSHETGWHDYDCDAVAEWNGWPTWEQSRARVTELEARNKEMEARWNRIPWGPILAEHALASNQIVDDEDRRLWNAVERYREQYLAKEWPHAPREPLP